MLWPKKTKYRKAQKGRGLNKTIASKGTELEWGELGLKSMEFKLLSSKEIESALNELKKRLGKKAKFWLRIFPHKPKTKKPPEVRMGGGKGDIEDYVAVVKPGVIIFEVSGLDKNLLRHALKSASYKFSIKTKIIEK